MSRFWRFTVMLNGLVIVYSMVQNTNFVSGFRVINEDEQSTEIGAGTCLDVYQDYLSIAGQAHCYVFA